MSGSVQVIDRAITLLDRFTLTKPAWSIADLSRETGMAKSTIHRLLNTLERHGVVEQNSYSREYRLGLKLFELGARAGANLDPVRVAEPHLMSLVETLGETAHIAVLHRGRSLYVAKVDGHRALRMPSAVGLSNPAHCTAVGKAILAFQPDEIVDEIVAEHGLARYTPNTITTRGELSRELAGIRSQGYAVDNEELEGGLRCIAAPVSDHSGEVVAALSVSGPVTRLASDRIPDIAAMVTSTALALGKDLGADIHA